MIIVIGDAILDRYHYGEVPRLSPEAPVPVFNKKTTIDVGGGACNVAKNVWALGGMPRLFGVVGQDKYATALVSALKAFDDSLPFHLQQVRIQTTVKSRYIAGSQHLLRVDSEAKCGKGKVQAVIDHYGETLPHADCVIFSDYGKHFSESAADIIRMANELEVPILVDPKSPDWTAYAGADLIKPNLAELHAAGGDITGLLKKFRIKQMLLTEGERGMTLWGKSKQPLKVQADAQQVIDVTGAGDTSIAAWAVGKSEALGDMDCLDFANAAAGVVCRKMGTAVCWRDEVE